VVLAPLSGYGDLPYRRMCRRCGMRHAFAPMVDASALAIGSKRTERIAERGAEEEWFGVQLVGGDPERIAAACEKVRRWRPDVVDLNAGCPAPKIRRKGQGCALVGDPERVARCVAAMVERCAAPVTVKTRLDPSATAGPVLEVIAAAAGAGAAAVTVHARAPRQKYGGPVHLDVLAEIVERASVPVIGNGGIYSRWHLERMRRIVDPYAFMVARGTMGNPWLFQHLDGPDPWHGRELPGEPVADPPPTAAELAGMVLEHVEATVELYGAERGFARTRKLVARYLKGRGLPGHLRVRASRIRDREDVVSLCEGIRR
jgi:tRNA-dihydrouridine synthase B